MSQPSHPSPSPRRFPNYPKKPHACGQARICVGGRHVYLGIFNSLASWTRYREELARWQVREQAGPVGDGVTVAWVIAQYLAHIEEEVAAGHLSAYANRDQQNALAPVLAMYGTEPVDRFGPRQLTAVGQAMLTGAWINEKEKARRKKIGARPKCSRQTTNLRLRKIKKAFKWAASQELVGWEVHHKLSTVSGFRVSRAAPDAEEVQPVDPELVLKTLPLLGPVTRAMVQLQQLTGMRSGEVCALTIDQIDREGVTTEDGTHVWLYRPRHDKTSYKRKAAPIAFGPKAQAILAPLMLRAEEPSLPLFSPRMEMEAITEERKAKAKLPSRSRGFLARHFKPGYSVQAYYRRVRAACERGKLAHWHPYQLRHLAEVTVERAFDLDAARAVLRHKDARMTTRYGIVDLKKAASVAAKIG